MNASRNFLDGGDAKKNLLDMWKKLDSLQLYFTKLALTDDEVHDFKAGVKNWGVAFLKYFGEHQVMQYIVN